MSTNELENKLKIIKDTGIHCPTLELAKQVLNIFNDLELKWCSDVSYIKCINWDTYKENTIYHPFEGRFSSLAHAQQINCEIISAEEFITLHTEEFNLENYVPKGQLKDFPKEVIKRMLDCQEEQGNKRNIYLFERNRSAGFTWDDTKEGGYFWHKVINNKNFDVFFEKYPKQDNRDNSQEFNLENYEPKGELTGFPKEVIKRMLDCQKEQGNPRDVSVFERQIDARQCNKGFDWGVTKEGWNFWCVVINNEDFNLFFEKYPKQDYQDNSQEFKVGDKVIYFITNKIGTVKEVKKHKFDNYIDIIVDYGNNDVCEYEIGSEVKRPFLLHYRDDYNYDIIDFNNLPKRQETNRWRAKVGEIYYCFTSNFKAEDYCEENDFFDDEAYDSGNYFKTKEKAQEVADKLNTYFQKIVKI